ncbi:uncharacterized protein B0H18DRAFT_1122146 [Fomitopsis serialis]|uniref:uncharacterized protein n=1 Tax=Fomitopsis serialis TaxID=139415 RepID=UPI002007E2AA|nr:uncharacterized protein B0H18DRAFT_1122146 [Neoantrodia serialis]KAH9920046.1 hypothetical protein B0H18DRAFT_1122146 [Neoantrodia serialis]
MNSFISLPTGPAPRDTPSGRELRKNALCKPYSMPTQPSVHSNSVLSSDNGIHWQWRRHEDWVKEQYRGKIVWNFDPAKFIQAVWGFGPEDVPPRRFTSAGRPSEGSAPLSFNYKASLRAYLLERRERKCYVPLANIANGLLNQMYGPKSGQQRERRAFPAQFRKRDRKYEGRYMDERVGMTFGTVELTRGKWPQWDFEAAFMEVKKTKTDRVLSRTELLLVDRDACRVAETSKRKRASADNGTELPKAKRARCTLSDDSEEAQDAPAAEDTQAKEVDPVRPQEVNMTHNEVQAVQYMNHLMSSNVRSFGIGWLVEDTNMRLYYGDRMGIVVTRKFKFLREESRLFMRCIAAMGQASVHGMGIFRDLHFPENKQKETEFERYEGSQLRITARRPDASEPEPFEFDVDVDGKTRWIYTQYGALGRGTSVIPIKATLETDTYQHFKTDKLVAKIAWPDALRSAEDSIVIAVRTKLSETKRQYLPHIVDLKCYVTRTIEEMKLPRAAMGLDHDDERVCRVLVMQWYQRLETVESVDDFKKVYTDVVRAHYWVWTTSHILHRDISTNNIMWIRIDGRLNGVLCDWDLAEETIDVNIASTRARGHTGTDELPASASNKRADGTATPADAGQVTSGGSRKKPKYPTGTAPFMAMDLLHVGPPPFHLYRHDLESFFYVLVYVCAVWDPEKRKFGHLSVWEQGTLVEIGRHKHDFLLDHTAYDITFKAAHPTLQHLAAYEPEPGWISSLAAQFGLIEAHGFEIRYLNFQRLRKRGTMHEERIKRIEAERENEISYEMFMEILGAPLDI